MGLFDKLKIKDKEEGKAWYINKQRGYVELEDNYIKLIVTFPKSEQIIFYKDITHIEKKYETSIYFKTNSEEYSIHPAGFGDVKKTIADENYIKLLEKIGEYK